MREFAQVGVQLRAAIIVGQPAAGHFAIPPVLSSIDCQLDPRFPGGADWPETDAALASILSELRANGCTGMRVLYPVLS